MNLLDYFNKIDISEIDRMVDEGQEENVHLEFKTTVHPIFNNDNREFDKKNLSEVISGFANSNGGIVIWGVKAKKNKNNQDIADQKKPILELTRFLNSLNRLEGQAVTPIVSGIIHRKILVGDDEGFVKTYIPPSDNAPHMANYSSKHYYKRSGDSFYICEHYDIRDMFQRRQYAELELLVKDKTEIDESILRGTIIRFEKVISMVNKGRNIARAPQLKVEINEPYFFSEFGLDGNGNIGLFSRRAIPRTRNTSTYMGGQDILLYPDILYDLDKIWLEVPKNTESLPALEIKYLIVAENAEKKSGSLTVKLK